MLPAFHVMMMDLYNLARCSSRVRYYDHHSPTIAALTCPLETSRCVQSLTSILMALVDNLHVSLIWAVNYRDASCQVKDHFLSLLSHYRYGYCSAIGQWSRTYIWWCGGRCVIFAYLQYLKRAMSKYHSFFSEFSTFMSDKWNTLPSELPSLMSKIIPRAWW